MVIDYFRKQKRESVYVSKGVESDHLENIEEVSEENFSLEELADISDQLSCLMEDLPADQQKVLKMRFYYNLSFKEIAEETGVSINTSLGRMRYAIINLRKLANKRNSAILKY
jgi:RNA polymerase sigma-70 factor (ECF subfamily)